MTDNEVYTPDEGMLDIFERALGKKDLNREQQRTLLEVCGSDDEVRDLLYFIVVKHRVVIRDVELAIKRVNGLGFALDIDRLRHKIVEEEAQEQLRVEMLHQRTYAIFQAPVLAMGV